MRLKLLYEQILNYWDFIKQPDWENILHYNYIHNINPLTITSEQSNPLDNDADYFGGSERSVVDYLISFKMLRDQLALSLVTTTYNADYAYQYASDVRGGRRWPAAERIIRQHPFIAYMYARNMINGRWPEAEGIIKTDPQCAYHYALDIIKGRWPEAEGIIKTDQFYWDLYNEELGVDKYQ